MSSGFLVWVVLSYLGGLFLAAVIGAAFLRIASGWAKAPTPPFSRATWIMLVAVFAVLALNILVSAGVVGATVLASRGDIVMNESIMAGMQIVAGAIQLVGIPVVTGFVISFLLPTSIGKGLMMAVMIAVMWFAVIFAIAFVAGLLVTVLG